MAKKGSFKTNVAEQFISAAEEIQEEKPKKAAKAPAKEDKLGRNPAINVEVPEGYRLAKEFKSERMQLLVRPALKKAIREEAAAQGISMNDLVNSIFEDYLERKVK